MRLLLLPLLRSAPAQAAKDVVLAEKPVIADDSSTLDPSLLEQLVSRYLATVAAVYHRPPETFVSRQRMAVTRAEELGHRKFEVGGRGRAAGLGGRDLRLVSGRRARFWRCRGRAVVVVWGRREKGPCWTSCTEGGMGCTSGRCAVCRTIRGPWVMHRLCEAGRGEYADSLTHSPSLRLCHRPDGLLLLRLRPSRWSRRRTAPRRAPWCRTTTQRRRLARQQQLPPAPSGTC